ncbi:MAG: radical SAM protein [Methanomicrobiales archaeon]|nr:radical SAM protein [Methanomicrobiales archaeon]
MQEVPFDPLQRAAEVESMVMRDGQRKYYRFRASRHYGGIVTADTIGCPFLCAYCWNYERNKCPEKEGEYYSTRDVVKKLTAIGRQKGIDLYRISGAEPILGQESFEHLLQVLEAGRFIIETNGLILGSQPHLVEHLKERNIAIRVSIKGWNGPSFEQLSGAKKEFFMFPLFALKQLIYQGIDTWPAVMGDLFGREGTERLTAQLEEMGIRTRIEAEYLERYPFVVSNLQHRGWKIGGGIR